MNDQSKMSPPPMSKDSPNVIGLQELQSGLPPSEEPDGPTTDQCGRAVVLASLSHRQAKEQGLTTSGTYGQRSSTSFSTASHPEYRSLVSRLQARTALLGSTLFKMTWKGRDTPSGRSISALRALAPRTSGKGSSSLPNPAESSWVTPSTRDHKDSPGMSVIATNPDGTERIRLDQLPRQAQLTSWPTPDTANVSDGTPYEQQLESMNQRRERTKAAVKEGLCKPGSGRSMTLQFAAQSAGWPTPAVFDVSHPKDTERMLERRAELKEKWGNNGFGMNLSQAATALSGWPTPTVKEKSGGEYSDPEKAFNRAMGPHANDLRDFAQMIGPARLTVSGDLLTGSSAGTTSGGQLNPALPRWLQGLPTSWDEASPHWEQWLEAIEKSGSKAMETPSTERLP